MNETTRAILRREVEQKKQKLSGIWDSQRMHPGLVQYYAAVLSKLQIEINDIKVVLDASGVAIATSGLPHIAPTEAMHIHNA